MADDNEDGKCWCPKLCFGFFILHWKTLFSIVWPILSLVVFFNGSDNKMRCMYVVLIMVGYWVTECIPLYMTSMLLPFLCPILTLSSSAVIARFYINSQVLTLVAVLMFAIVYEHNGYHIRIALCLMRLLHCDPRNLQLYLTLIAYCLSMLVMNTFVVAIMCPIIMCILAELENQGVIQVYEPPDPAAGPDAPLRPSKITLAYFFTILFASTIGRIGSKAASTTFPLFRDDFHKKFPTAQKFERSSWTLMFFFAPGSITMYILSCFTLQITCMGLFRKTSKEYEICEKWAERKDAIRDAVIIKYKELGAMTFAEIVIAILFTIILFIWILTDFRDFEEGEWKDGPSYIENSCFPFFFLVLMCILPATCSCVNYCNRDKNLRPYGASPGILTWDAIQTRFPFGVYLLFCSGIALSKIIETNGAYEILRYPIEGLEHFVPFFVAAFSSFIASVMTEVLPNECVHKIVMKPMLDMAVSMEVHPLRYAFPVLMCCNYGFLLPTAGPTYAIVLAYAKIPTIELIKHGMLTKLMTWLLITILLNTYGLIFYDFFNAPDYIKQD